MSWFACVRAISTLGCLLALSTACGGGGGDSPTAPTAAGGPALDPNCPPSSAQLTCGPVNTLTVGINVNAPGAWTLNVAGLALSGSGSYHARIIGISPGTVQVSGTAQGNFINILLGVPQTNVGGSVPPSSVQSLSGPSPAVSNNGCTIQYNQTGTSTFAFSLSFSLSASGAPFDQSCHG